MKVSVTNSWTRTQGMIFSRRLLWGGALLCVVSTGYAEVDTEAEAESEAAAPQVVVQGQRLTLQQEEQKRLERSISGAVSVVDNSEIERGRAFNAEDFLALQPGIFAQGTSGTGAAKISIRGSGAGTYYGGYFLGIKYLFDGFSITGSYGTQETLLTIAGVDRTEILYGGNAFTDAAASLGGAINFVTHTGETDPGYRASLDFGELGFRKQYASVGGTSGDSDYYVAFGHNERDGYQDSTPNKGTDGILNFGHRFNDQLSTRLLVKYRDEVIEPGSTLSLAQIRTTPTLNRVLNRRETDALLIGSKTQYTFDSGSEIEVNLAYNHFRLYFPVSAFPSDYDVTDLSAYLRYTASGNLFGRESRTNFIFSDVYTAKGEHPGYSRTPGAPTNPNGTPNRDYVPPGELAVWRDGDGSHDRIVALGNETALTGNLWLSTGVSLINIVRKVRVDDVYARPNGPDGVGQGFGLSLDYDEWDVAPRVGLRYTLSPEIQIFGNVTRSVDPPNVWQYISAQPPVNSWVVPLVPQTATTAELGVRGSHGIFDGSLTVYRSEVDDELLRVVLVRATPGVDEYRTNANASPTIHQGIEAGLTTHLWDGGPHQVVLRQTYALNDFYYEGDERFGTNELPGLPRHVWQGELQYQQTGGFYVGVNTRAASGFYADFANTLKAPSNTIWGAKLGWDSPTDKWRVYLDVRNLTDEHYVTTSATEYDLGGIDQPVFYVGDPRSVYGGFSVRF